MNKSEKYFNKKMKHNKSVSQKSLMHLDNPYGRINPKRNLYHIWYHILQKIPITKPFTLTIRRRYESLFPGDKGTIVRKTVFTTGVIILLSFLCVCVLFLRKPSVYTGFLTILSFFVFFYEILHWAVRNSELKLLMQMDSFLSEIRHNYYISHMVDEAILDSMDQIGSQIRIHADVIYQIITAENMEEKAESYNEMNGNKFLKLFLALCVTVVEYGDKTIDSQSLFLLNLTNLKTEVNLEILKLKQIQFHFSGLSIVTLLPIFCLDYIKNWGISNLPELEVFYEQKGILIAVILILTTLLIYVLVNSLKEDVMNQKVEHPLLEYLLKNKILFKGIENYMEFRYVKMKRLQVILEDCGEGQFRMEIVLKSFLYALLAFIGSSSMLFYLHRVNGLTGSYLLWYEVLIALGVAYCSYHFPYLMLLYKKKLIQMNMEDEVIKFQSIVLMLMYIDRMTVFGILERVEDFSLIFRGSLRRCINDFNFSDSRALEDLKEAESFEPFRRFVDQLMISDMIGIEKAFDEIAADRLHFQEKRKQENEINLIRRSTLAKFIAYIPVLAVIGGYLILPFIQECFAQLGEYSDMMNSLY